MNFSIQNNQVMLNGVPGQIRSGAIHYFRTLPEQWEDRLVKLKRCGFNTVETYMAWHLHEIREGEFDFSGCLDVVNFLRTAAAVGLMAIVRPGPYICSECDLGGIPGWLLGKNGVRLRCENRVFMRYAARFLNRALALLAPLQCTRGGNLIAMQVENEYGSYAADKKYIAHLCQIFRTNGIEVQLFTSDCADRTMLKAGTYPGLPATVNCRNHPARNFQILDSVDTGFANAHFIMELWNGKAWCWGVRPQHHGDADVAADIREIMEENASVNCYMFHGGTNFGFTSGANYNEGHYLPFLTGYEVDGVLDEGGNCGGKYSAIRSVIEEFRPGTTMPPPAREGTALPSVFLTEFVSLRDSLAVLSRVRRRALPETMEFFGQSFGFIHYATRVHPHHSGTYFFRNLRDRAITLLNGEPIGTTYREDRDQTIRLEVREANSVLEILVENMGRINWGLEMENERKGITGFSGGDNYVQLCDWAIRPLPLNDLSRLNFSSDVPEACRIPGFYRARFDVGEIRDTYVRFPDGVRGYVWINGFNLGRYWNIGPQRTLYLPAPLLKKAGNELIVFELHGLNTLRIDFSPERVLDPMTPMPLP